MEDDVTVRFRIDGVLQVVQRLPKRVQLGLISRLKILSRLDISEKRLPQDGRISVTMEGKPIDFRVSTVPGKWGEKVVMRLLDKSNTALGLDKLISHAPVLALVREMIAAAVRHHLRHRADRIRQDHDAVFGAGGDQRSRREHLDRRRSDRVRPAGRHADPDERRTSA